MWLLATVLELPRNWVEELPSVIPPIRGHSSLLWSGRTDYSQEKQLHRSLLSVLRSCISRWRVWPLLTSNSTKALYRFPTRYLKWQSPPTLKTVFFFSFANSVGNKICPELMQINSQSLFIPCIFTPFCFRSINMFVMGASRPHICGLIWYIEDIVFLKFTKS